MPKFTVTAEVQLRTYITPYGEFTLYIDGIEDFEDSSRWDEDEINFPGGQISFVITADSQEAAEQNVDDLLADYLSFASDNIEWEIERVDVMDIEPIEEPMTRGRAVEILRAYLVRPAEANAEELRKAIEFLLTFMAARPLLTTPPVGQEVES